MPSCGESSIMPLVFGISFFWGHNPDFMIIRGARSADQPVGQKLCLFGQHLLHQDKPVQRPHYSSCRTDLFIDLMLHSPCTHEENPKKLLHFRHGLSFNLNGIGHPFLVENHGLRTGGDDSQTRLFTLSYELPQYMQSWQMGASRTMQSLKAGARSFGPQTLLPLVLGCT